jgi:hypothetical protein
MRCKHCGERVELERKGSNALIGGILMIVIASAGGLLVFHKLAKNTDSGSGILGDKIGQLAE